MRQGQLIVACHGHASSHVKRLGCALVLLFAWNAASALGQNPLQELEQRLRTRLGSDVNQSREDTNQGSDRPAVGMTLEEQVTPDGRSSLVVTEVEPGSPAALAGLAAGDRIEQLGQVEATSLAEASAVIEQLAADRRIAMVVRRGRQRVPVLIRIMPGDGATAQTPPLEPPSADLPPPKNADGAPPRSAAPRENGRLGVVVDDPRPGGPRPIARGAIVREVTPDSPAGQALMKAGDVIVAVDGKKIGSARQLTEWMQTTVPGQRVEVTYFQGDSLVRAPLELAGPEGSVPPVAAAPPANTERRGGLGSWIGGILGGGSQTPDRNALPADRSVPLDEPFNGNPPTEDPFPLPQDPGAATGSMEDGTGTGPTAGPSNELEPSSRSTPQSPAGELPPQRNAPAGAGEISRTQLRPPVSNDGPNPPSAPVPQPPPPGVRKGKAVDDSTSPRVIELLQRLDVRLRAIEARLTAIEERLGPDLGE